MFKGTNRVVGVLVAALLGAGTAWGQRLDIITSGNTGTSGTNWTSTDNGTTFEITATGTANIHPSVVTTALGAGKNVVVNAGEIWINAAIAYTGNSAARLTLKSKAYVANPGYSITSTSAPLDLVFWADSDNSQSNTASTANDEIVLSAGITISSNGGLIHMAGGLDDGSNGGVANDGLPDGYAYRGTAGGMGGLQLGSPSTNGATIVIASNGGNITMRGMSAGTQADSRPGITSQASFRIDAGAGKIDLQGYSTVNHGIEFTFGVAPDIAIVSSYSGSGPAIRIAGGTTRTDGYKGILLFNNVAGNFLVQSSSSTGGGILLEAGSANSSNSGYITTTANSAAQTQFLSGAGDIEIRSAAIGASVASGSLELYGNMRFGTRVNTTVVAGVAPSVTTSQAIVKLVSNSPIFDPAGTNVKVMQMATTGTVSILPVSASFSAAQTIRNLSLTNVSGLTYGASGNTAAVTVGQTLNVAGPVTVFGGDVTIDNPVSTSTATGHQRYIATGNVVQNTSDVLTTSGGSVILWSDADGNGAGYVKPMANITTNGGHVYLGGGSATETVNGLTVPSGYATSTTNTEHGVDITGITISTGGGDLRVKGLQNSVDGSNAGVHVSNATIQTGAGDLELYGNRIGNPNNSSGLWLGTTFATSAATGNVLLESTSGNITLEGTADATSAHTWCHGFAVVHRNGDDVIIRSTSGNLVFTGTSTATTGSLGESQGFVIQVEATNGYFSATTDGGTITINGSGSNSSPDFGIDFRSGSAANNISFGDANTGAITVRASSLYATSTTAGGTVFTSAGGYVVEGWNGGAFALATTLTTNYSFASSGTSFRFGSTGNTQNVTLETPVTVAGPISVYGGTASISKSMIATTASDITVSATNGVSTPSSSTRIEFRSANGNILVDANSDANTTGTLEIDFVTFDAGTGTTTLRAYYVVWSTATLADKPYINGTGAWVLEPSGTTFGQGINTVWFFIDQDANGIGGVTIGKLGNTYNVVADHPNGMSVAGPVALYGAVVAANTPITVTKLGSHIRMEASESVNNTAALTTNGGPVVLWANNDGVGNGYVRMVNVSTNGGPLWAGGGTGNRVWNGTTVGNSFVNYGTSGSGIYVNGTLDTRVTATPTEGGDVMLCGGTENAAVYADITAESSNRSILAGNGDIALLSRDGVYIYSGSGIVLSLQTTGSISLAPISGANWLTSWDFKSHTNVANAFTGNGPGLWGIQVMYPSSLSAFHLGTYVGTGLVGDDPYVASNTQNISITSAFSVGGAVRIKGGTLDINGSITSTGDGDIELTANALLNLGTVSAPNVGIYKTGGSGTLTAKANGRILFYGTVRATAPGLLNVVLWSDADGTDDGGVSPVSEVTTNGGHVWIGGSGAGANAYTWNGLTVGDGPSVAASSANWNAIDFVGPVSTSGGDVLIWSGAGYSMGASGLLVPGGASGVLNAGSGDITLLVDGIYGGPTLTTTGLLTFAPSSGSYPSTWEWAGSGSPNFTLSGSFSGTRLNNVESFGGLRVGRCADMSFGGNPVVLGNTSDITLASALTVNGPVELYGDDLVVSAGLTAAGDVLFDGATLDANGNVKTTGVGSDVTLDVATASFAPGTYLWSSGGITNNGTLTLEAANVADGAYSQMKFGGAFNAGIGSTITQQQYLEEGRHLVGAPFVAGTAAFFGGDNPGQGGVGGSGTLYPAGNMNFFGWSGSDWEPLADNDALVTPGKGYIGYVGANGFRKNPGLQSFTGSLPNATTSVSITKSSAASSVVMENESQLGRIGWNLVANPFPCAIDATGIASNGNGLHGAVYRWNPRSNGNNGAYEAHSPAGSQTDNHIAPLQAFWVQATSSGQITLSMNTHGTVLAAPVFRKTTDFEADRFRFEVVRKDKPSFKDVSFVAIAEGTTDGYDREWDAHKLSSGDEAVYLYTLGTDGTSLANNALEYTEDATAPKQVPMAFRAPGHGETFSLQLDAAAADGDYDVFLEDRVTRTMHDLRSAAYSFVHDSTVTERFRVHFRSAKAREYANMGGVEAPLNVWTRPGELVFWMNQPATGRWTLMGLDGKEIQFGKVVLDGTSVHTAPIDAALSHGIYLVRTRLANGTTVFVRVML